ncbi:mannose-6-phosphate isomerase [Rhizopogon salebrosus TDB-379]|nr:mannose-6-phosphate isomerase [Rhizopogon salebrosus TDB-379]
MISPVFHLIPATKSYPWGKKGRNSLAAQLAEGAGIPDFKIDESTHYAELWMGTHPNAPARVLSTGELLSAHLAAHPELVGESVIKRFGLQGGQIPFLLKVLSFDKALPVQIHPDKLTAQRIHLEKPDSYPDPNHKPEMALALSDFGALCGFLPTFQISEFLSAVPEFASLLPRDVVQHFKSVARSPDESERKAALRELFSSYVRVDNEKAAAQLERKAALRELFSSYVRVDNEKAAAQLKSLVERYQAGKETEAEKQVKSLVLRLHEMYPDDSGVFCAFIMNHFELKPGNAFSVAAGEPHAYITGDIIECMATSDNTIAVAFSPPEERDVDNFLSGVQFNPTHGKTVIQPTMFTRGSTHTHGSLTYNPAIDELAVMQVIVGKGDTQAHNKLRGPSIAIAIEGEGTVVWADGANRLGMKKGQVVFIATGTDVKFSAFETSFKLYRAFVEVI